MRRWGRPIALAIIAAGLVAPLPAAQAVRAQDAADPAATLLERYKPFVALRTHLSVCGPGERYLPVPVDTIFGRPDVVLRDESGDVLKIAPTAADLAAGPEDRWIDLPGNALIPGCTYEKWFRTLDASPAIYGRVVQEGEFVVAQYWLYWVFNQWNDVHESDWEMAQVMIPAPSVEQALQIPPTTYAYAQHEGSQFAIPTEDDVVLLTDGTHPIVFSAEGSHASYFESGLWFGKSAATGFGCDDTTGPVEVIEPELLVLPEGDDPPTTGPLAWLSYRGHWGEQQPAFADGPTGPYMKQQWSEPVTWVADLGREQAVRIPFASSPATGMFCRLTAAGSALFNQLLDRPWVILGASALALAALALLVLRSSQGILVRSVRTFWRVRHQLIPAFVMVGVGVGAAYLSQGALLRWTPLGTLTDVAGGSSAWAAPVIALTQAVVIIPMFAWAATVALASVRPVVIAGPDAPRRSRKVRTFWILLLVTFSFAIAVTVFLPLALAPSRWMVAPVVASRHRGTLRGALAESNRLVKGHWLRSVCLLLTMGFIVLVTMSVGAIVLLLTPLTFTAAGAVTGALCVLLVPYLTLVLQEYHAVLLAAHAADDARAAVPVTAPV